AVYLERGPARASRVAPAPVAALPSLSFHDPVAAEAAVPSRPIPAPSAAPSAAPAASSAAPAARAAALSAPSLQPHNELRTPQPQYWVEYGVYVGASYARRLQQTLARDGIRALVVTT